MEFKKHKGIDYVLSWKSNGIFNSKLKPLYTTFLNSIKLSKIVNAYIAYDLGAWPRNPTNNFKFKNCLFGAPTIVKNSDKEKYVCRGYGITFDSWGSWSFDNDFARNVVIFGVDHSSSSHSDNRKNNFLILGEGPT